MTTQATGSRISGSFKPDGGSELTFLVTGFSVSAEDRPQIDITSGTDVMARTVPGKRGVTTVTINARYDGDVIDALDTATTQCAKGELKIAAAATADCGVVPIIGNAPGTGDVTFANMLSFYAFFMGYNIEATSDSAVDITMNFLVNTTGSAIDVESA